MINRLCILFTLICLFLSTCTNPKQTEAEKLLTSWTNKTVVFSNDIPCSYMGRDTVCPGVSAAPYKILLYVDSTGCTGCKLKMYQWQDIMSEADSLFAGKLSFLFYFHPKDIKELQFLLRRDRLDFPVFVDGQDKLNKQNNFPQDALYQCFLLDRDNKVVAIGNPAMNPKVWELYKRIITGAKDEPATDAKLTTVSVETSEIELPNLQAGKTNKTTFTLKNTGNRPLIINSVNASCGCTVPSWEKQPVKSGETTTITVEVTPKETGYFHKTITVYCNIADNFVTLFLNGTVTK